MNPSCGIETKVKGIINIKVKKFKLKLSKSKQKRFVNVFLGLKSNITFENLILDTFFARFAAGNTLFGTGECRVGTGTTPPSNSDTALVSQLRVQTHTSVTPIPPAIDNINNRLSVGRAFQFEFAQGSVVGNLAEIGFEFSKSTGGVSANSLNSRSLIKDSFGTPIVQIVTADDQLVINYTFQAFIPLVDYTTSITLGGVNHSVLGRVAGDFTNRTLNDILDLPAFLFGWFTSYAANSVFGGHGVNPTATSGAQGGGSGGFTNYFNIAGGKEVEVRGSINQMNATGGIGVISIPSGSGSGAFYKYQFTPAIAKTNQKVLTLRFRMTCVRA